MEIWFEQGGSKFRLPINPPDVSVNGQASWEDVNVSGKGEYTAHNGKLLAEYSFSSIYPKSNIAYLCSSPPTMSPNDFNKIMVDWRDNGTPIRLIITSLNINQVVTIRSFEYKEQAGANGDSYYSISLKEYKELSVIKLSPIPAPVVPDSTSKPATTKTYTVKKGDCLWNIAKKFYGNGSKWPTIYNHPQNKKTIGKNPNLIRPNQKLIIP